MYLSILLPSILALYALYKKKITIPGIIFAWTVGVIITHFGGIIPFTALAATFILTIISDKIKKTKRDKTRDIYQMISNILASGLCIVLYSLTNNNTFYVMYFAVIASSLSDTLASSIGTLAKGKPINLFTMQKLETGESGGVSWLGLFASLMGGVVIGAIYLINDFNLSNFAFISLMGLFGSLIDSVLGTIFQAQYKCSVCKKTVEEKKHCNKNTKLIKGYPLIDNNLVNLLNNVLIFIFSYILLI